MLNSPPGAGKDTFANIANTFFPRGMFLRYAFAAPLWRGFRALNGLEHLDDKTFEHHKRNKTPTREFAPWLADAGINDIRPGMIDLAEKYMKEKYGPDVFAKIQARSVDVGYETFNKQIVFSDGPPVSCVTDLGFDSEYDLFVERFALRYPMFLVYIERDGCDYASDSRGRVENKVPDLINSFSIKNPGDRMYESVIRAAFSHIYRHAKDWKHGKAWA